MKKSFLYVLLVCFFILSFGNQNILAERRVKIATIGAVPPHLSKSLSYQQQVEHMIRFLQKEINQVLPDRPDLIVLPEACDRPAGMNVKEQFEYFRVRGNQVQNFLSSIAKKNHCYIAFGIKHPDEYGVWRNSCVLLDRYGRVAGIYDKNFPTPDEMEGGIVASHKVGLIQTDFGTVGCAICFDLNFDELREQYARLKPDIILFPSMYHGGLVQAQWAYSCHSYFVSSIGVNDLFSVIMDPLGEVLATTTNYFDFVVYTVNLDFEIAHLDNNWEKLDSLKKKYGEKVNIHDPGEIGVVLISSESSSITAKDMIREFNIETVEHYFNRTRSLRHEPGQLK